LCIPPLLRAADAPPPDLPQSMSPKRARREERSRKRGRGGEDEEERTRRRGRGGEDEEERTRKRGRGREDEEERTRKRGRGREDEEERTRERGRAAPVSSSLINTRPKSITLSLSLTRSPTHSHSLSLALSLSLSLTRSLSHTHLERPHQGRDSPHRRLHGLHPRQLRRRCRRRCGRRGRERGRHRRRRGGRRGRGGGAGFRRRHSDGVRVLSLCAGGGSGAARVRQTRTHRPDLFSNLSIKYNACVCVQCRVTTERTFLKQRWLNLQHAASGPGRNARTGGCKERMAQGGGPEGMHPEHGEDQRMTRTEATEEKKRTEGLKQQTAATAGSCGESSTRTHQGLGAALELQVERRPGPGIRSHPLAP
jgi:hypothetical protein